ncbi:MAG: aldehyde dehydrogenase family protein [Deltaproteobacteria bacterium]
MERLLQLGGRATPGVRIADVRSPFDGSVVSRVHQADWPLADRALALALGQRGALSRQSAGRRRATCQGISDGLAARAAELAELMAREAGKPITAARGEVARAVTTFALAAGEVARYGGELLPVDFDEASAGYQGFCRLEPNGPIVGISPFNFPLNLTAHKVAPALAIGAPIVLKPPPQAPSAALILAEVAAAAGAPEGALSVLPCDNGVAERLATDPRVRLLSFTGSARVGWSLRRKVERARVLLELGGNAGAVIAEDAKLDWAIERCARAAFVYAGQVCISLQRLFVHRSVYPRVLAGLVSRAQAWPAGDPLDEGTVVGPLIDEAAAARVVAWIGEARALGATIACGGGRKGTLVEPTVITGAPRQAKVVCEEAFGPLVVVEPYDDFEAALAALDEGDFGLQAAIFTENLGRVRLAIERLEVGGLIVNDAPSFRSDNMPYGGRKGSGLGREGLRYAMEELSERKLIVLGPR